MILLLKTDSRHKARRRAGNVERLLASAHDAAQQCIQSIRLVALSRTDPTGKQRRIRENRCRDLWGLAGYGKVVLRNGATGVKTQDAEELQHRAKTERVF